MKYFLGLLIALVARAFIVLGVTELYLLGIGRTHFSEGRELGVISALVLLCSGLVLGIIGWYLSYKLIRGWLQLPYQSVAIVGAVLGINVLFNYSSSTITEIVIAVFGTLFAASWWYVRNKKNA